VKDFCLPAVHIYVLHNETGMSGYQYQLWKGAVVRQPTKMKRKSYAGSENHSPNKLRKRRVTLVPGTVKILHH